MAINPATKYPLQTEPASTEFPYGKAQNVTISGDGKGTPWEKDLINDVFGFQQALLKAGGLTPSGSPDEVGASQYLQSLFKSSGLVKESYALLRLVTSTQLSDKTSCLITDDGISGFFTLDKTDAVTVDNGGTVIVDADGGRWKRNFSGPINVKWFGAVGDGVVDDTNAIQLAVNTLKEVYFPNGIYRMASSLVPPTDDISKVINITGSNKQYDFSGGLRYLDCRIVCESDFISSGIEAQRIIINMKDIAFLTASYTNILFNGYNLEFSNLDNVFATGFESIIKGKTSNLTRIDGCTFVDLAKHFITNSHFAVSGDRSVVDSNFTNNYISGSISQADPSLQIAFDCIFMTHCTVSGNYIDFWYKGFFLNTGNTNTIFNNLIDYCFIGIDTKFFRDSVISSHIFNHIAKAYAGSWNNPTTAMLNDDWTAYNVGISNNNLSIIGNSLRDSESPIYIGSSGNTKIITSGNTSDVLDLPIVINRTIDGGDADDGLGLQFNELNNVVHASLPVSPLASFEGHTIIRHKELISNVSDEWVSNGKGANLLDDYLFNDGSWWGISAAGWTQDTGAGTMTATADDLFSSPTDIGFITGDVYTIELNITATTATVLNAQLGSNSPLIDISPTNTTRQIVSVELTADTGFTRLYIQSVGFRGIIHSIKLRKNYEI